MKPPNLRSRRQFLKEGVAGLAGAALLPGCSGEPRPPGARPKEATTTVRALGRTGLQLPVVSMGAGYAVNLVKKALDEGVVYIHTSAEYGEENQERLLGDAFRGRSRDSFVVATSPALPYRFPRLRGRSVDLGLEIDPRLIVTSIEGSLKRLRVDAIDIYYLCSVGVREVQYEPYLEAYQRLKEAGKARFIGVGTHEHEPDVIRAAVEAELWDVVLTAYNFRQSHRSEVGDAIAEAARAGLGVVAMKTQAGVYWDRQRTRMINMKAALKWVLTDENVHTAIPAFATFDELSEGLSVMEDLALTPEECRDLEIGDRLGLAGNFCQQCGRCLPQCTVGMDIPTWMRASMYDVGHGRPGKAEATLGERRFGSIACASCTRCEVECALGLDVRARALELATKLGLRA